MLHHDGIIMIPYYYYMLLLLLHGHPEHRDGRQREAEGQHVELLQELDDPELAACGGYHILVC